MIAEVILTLCAIALGTWALASMMRGTPCTRRLKPHEREWATVLGVPEATTLAELEAVTRPRERPCTRPAHREHVHTYEDADWSDEPTRPGGEA